MWGWIFLILGVFIFQISWVSNRRIGKVLFVAFLLRAAAALVHRYLFTLPAGCCDAVRFEQTAWQWSQYSWDTFALLYNPQQSYVISWVGGLVYSVFGRDPFLLQMVNVMIGTVIVFVVYKTAVLFMREKHAYIAAWMVALHPTLIEHSAVFLREAAIVFCLSVSIYFFVKWLQEYGARFLLFSVLAIIVSALFHGAMIVGIGIMVAVAGTVVLYRITQAGQTSRIRRGILPTLVILAMGMGALLLLQELPRLSSIGDLDEMMQVEEAAMEAGDAYEVRTSGSAAYLEGMTVNNPADVVWQAPVRVVYFLYSPFPWDVTALRHIKGFIDSGFLLFITFLMVKYRRELWRHPVYRTLFFILLVYVVVFSFGSANFGSAIRHKSKFLPLFVMFYGLKGLRGR